MKKVNGKSFYRKYFGWGNSLSMPGEISNTRLEMIQANNNCVILRATKAKDFSSSLPRNKQKLEKMGLEIVEEKNMLWF